MAKYNCKWCKQEFNRKGKKIPTFCSLSCKGEWQKTQKPVDKEWLIQRYINEKLGCYEIGRMVNRNPKQVWEWLKGYNIPVRDKSESVTLFNKRDTTRKKRIDSLTGRKITAETRSKISLGRTGKKYPKLSGKGNGMFGRKGILSPAWKGGCTPERNSFYESIEWKDAIKQVWKREGGYCQRCKIKSDGKIQFHMHHIVSFKIKELRAEPTNLALLCKSCHNWVHSKQNTEKQFIKEYGKNTE